jgi:hypothetical protein
VGGSRGAINRPVWERLRRRGAKVAFSPGSPRIEGPGRARGSRLETLRGCSAVRRGKVTRAIGERAIFLPIQARVQHFARPQSKMRLAGPRFSPLVHRGVDCGSDFPRPAPCGRSGAIPLRPSNAQGCHFRFRGSSFGAGTRRAGCALNGRPARPQSDEAEFDRRGPLSSVGLLVGQNGSPNKRNASGTATTVRFSMSTITLKHNSRPQESFEYSPQTSGSVIHSPQPYVRPNGRSPQAGGIGVDLP